MYLKYMFGDDEMLDKATIAIIHSTVPVLKEHGVTITKTFYRNMFEEHPELLNIFNGTNQKVGRQPVALANLVLAAAEHIDNLEAVLAPVLEVAHKHRSLEVKPEHYPIVGHHLIGAIQEVLGEAATPEIVEAWTKAYGVIADVFISIEKELYEKSTKQPHGFEGYVEMICTDKIKESDTVTSFIWQRKDGQPLPVNLPGQYITLRVQIPGETYLANRQYTVSTLSDGSHYRTSIQREANGLVSNYLHEHLQIGDTVEMTAPAGVFHLGSTAQPVTFLAAGVGITPILAMTEQMAVIQDKVPHQIIHSHRGEHSPFRDYFNTYCKKHPTASFTAYDTTTNPRIDQSFLAQQIPVDHHVYLCGPTDFMAAMRQALIANGLPAAHIFYEQFGPAVTMEVKECN